VNEILVLYYSRFGATEALAREVCLGIDTVTAATSRLRTVPALSALTATPDIEPPEKGPPYVVAKDLHECGGLVMGSPTRFGNMAAPLKHFIDSTGTEWAKGTLNSKPAGVFTSTSTLHGGQETTLLTMALPLLHHGMFLVGIPFTESALSSTRTGGSPYGASHVTWNRDADCLSDEERKVARALGTRIASLAVKLS
tara:strand:+ start:2070 stop:2660 length:591 start_codon:yes stop_codon:yes gene_type:complete